MDQKSATHLPIHGISRTGTVQKTKIATKDPALLFDQETNVSAAVKQTIGNMIVRNPLTDTKTEIKRNDVNYDLSFNSETKYSHQDFKFKLDTKYPTVRKTYNIDVTQTVEPGYKVPFLTTRKKASIATEN